MFHTRYVPLVERKRLAREYLDLRQTTETVTEITKMFTERDLFYPKFTALEQAQITQYLNMLKTNIR